MAVNHSVKKDSFGEQKYVIAPAFKASGTNIQIYTVISTHTFQVTSNRPSPLDSRVLIKKGGKKAVKVSGSL